MDLLSTTMIGAHSEDYKKCLKLYFEEVRKRKPKRVKVNRNVDQSMTFLATDYYHVKDFEEEELLAYNPHVIENGEVFSK